MTNASTTLTASRSGFNTRLDYAHKFLRKVVCLRVALLIASLAAGSVSIVVGCGWWGTERSVRFNGYVTESQMSRLPPLDFLSGDDDPNGRRTDDEMEIIDDDEARVSASNQSTARARELWQRANQAERNGELRQVSINLHAFLQAVEDIELFEWTLTDRQNPYSNNELRFARASAFDRLDALTALDAGASPDLVQAYLAARDAYDGRSDELRAPAMEVNAATPGINFNPAFNLDATRNIPPPPPPPQPTPHNFASVEEAALGVPAAERLNAAAADHRLRDNCNYLRAAIRYRNGDYTDAAARFQQIADARPSSEKRDAARFMSGLSWMKASRAYAGAETSAVGVPACQDCQDAEWMRARDAFAALARSNSPRFGGEARGWLAYLYLRVGRTGDGLAEYYRLLACPDCKEMRPTALLSLRMARPTAQSADMDRVEQILADDTQAALAYIYHNTYNYTFLTLFSWDAQDDYLQSINYDSSGDYKDRQKTIDRQRDSLQRTELMRVANFTNTLLRAYPRANISASFATLLAGINLELGEHRHAHDLAERALRLGATGDFRAESLWVKGVAENRLSKSAAARRTLQTLVAEYPQHRLTEGARRHLAMAAEDAGDLNAALEQYIALDYVPDTAYFLDVLMSPEQIRSFIEDHPQHERLDELWYALGVRYMRDGRWAAAREAYSQVRTVKKYEGETADSCFWSTDTIPREKPFPKSPTYPSTGRGVQAYWVLSDLKTIDALEKYELQYALASGAEERAEALYQRASYLFEANTLLLYNPAAWGTTNRYYNLSELHDTNAYRAPDEAARLLAYSERHEPVAQALAIYLQIVEQYPHTRAAPDALYTAAVCHERLTDYNPYWREIYDKRLHAGSRLVTYADVRRTYPRYQLPRATLGWEPMTRTVSGGKPGWSPKPEPAPRLSKFERGRRKAWAIYEGVTTPVAAVWRDTLRPPLVTFNSWAMVALRWLLAACAFACLLTMWRAAAWSRRVWRERVRRREQSGGASALAVRVAHGRKAHAKFLRRSRRALDWDYREVRDGLRLRAIASYRFALRRGRRALPTLAASSRRNIADPHERQLLALNALTHGAFVVLLITLLRLI